MSGGGQASPALHPAEMSSTGEAFQPFGLISRSCWQECKESLAVAPHRGDARPTGFAGAPPRARALAIQACREGRSPQAVVHRRAKSAAEPMTSLGSNRPFTSDPATRALRKTRPFVTVPTSPPSGAIESIGSGRSRAVSPDHVSAGVAPSRAPWMAVAPAYEGKTPCCPSGAPRPPETVGPLRRSGVRSPSIGTSRFRRCCSHRCRAAIAVYSLVTLI